MAAACPDSGSFRDRSGRIYHRGDRIFRTVMPPAVDDHRFVRDSGLIDELVASGGLIAETPVDAEVLDGAAADASVVLEHPKLAFVSYPYEWSFGALKAAALLHLDVHLAALERGVTLSDATAYNVQFSGSRPVFIDALSFRRYVDGEYWSGHRQFCDQFLNPLLLRALFGIPHNAWYRGALEGIGAEQINDLLPWYRKLRWNLFTHVVLQARLQRGTAADDAALTRAEARKLPLIGYQQILHGLRRWIAALEPRDRGATVWQGYADDNSYRSEEETAKRRFVAEFVTAEAPGTLWDVGCNTGDYSRLALESGAKRVIGFDFDPNAVEAAFERARADKQDFLPLVMDAVNPSPGQGWQQSERKGLTERADADAVVALALIHHLAIGKNIPFDQAVDWLVGLAPVGVIEFVQKTDPMVLRLLRLREDIFVDYDQQIFETLLAARARIEKVEQISAQGRRLYWYRRA